MTLLPQRLFNETTKVEKIKTDYKDFNDNKIEFIGQTNATVETNRTSIQLSLFFTKSSLTPRYRARLDETTENNNQLKHRSYQNTLHRKGLD